MKNCMIWGGMGDGSVETSLLCFCMRWGHARIQEFLPGGVQARLPENSSDNFFSPQFYRGCPIVISNKTIIFNIFRGGGGVQMLISIETHITYDFPGGGSGPPTPLWIRTWGDCACAHAHFEPSLLANATSTRMSLVSRDACNEQMINCNCTHQSSSSQAKGTNSTSFLVLVPLACEDDQSFENHPHIWTCS